MNRLTLASEDTTLFLSWIAMELVEGRTLRDAIAQGPLRTTGPRTPLARRGT